MQTASNGTQMAAAASAKTAHRLHEADAQWLLEVQVPDPAHLAVLDMLHVHKQPMWKAGQQVQRCGRKRPTQSRHALSASRAPRCQWRRQARDKTPCEVTHTGNDRQTTPKALGVGGPSNVRSVVSASENFEDYSCCVVRAHKECGHTSRLHPHVRRRV